MTVRLPKSVRESQRFVAWAFPALLGFGAASIPHVVGDGRIGIVFGMLIVFVGWASFGILEEEVYNDVLLMVDLALLVCYFLLFAYAADLTETAGSADLALWNVSAAVFFLYAIWDVAALAGRDTAAMATAIHLKRFARWCLLIGVLLFISARVLAGLLDEGSDAVTSISRGALAGTWTTILVWWNLGKFRAALEDSAS